MSDPLCVGVCMIDWAAGVCMGCGRTTEEIDAAVDDSEQASPEPSATQDAAAPDDAAPSSRAESS